MRHSIAASLTFIAMLHSASAAAEPRLGLTLKPEASGADGNIAAVEVTLRLESMSIPSGGTLIELPLVVSNVRTSALDLRDLTATDAQGAVPLAARDDAGRARRWIAGRAVTGACTVRYRAPIDDAPNALGAAPPLELRAEDGGFSAQGTTFLALPPFTAAVRAELKWDLSGLPAASSGLSSFGVGDIVFKEPIEIARLSRAFYMGGTVGRHPATPMASGFFSAWQGSPPFDAQALMSWTERLYYFYFDFFKPSAKPFAVFLRFNPINPGGGVEGANSFIGTFGPKTDPQEFRGTLAHEMIHTYVGTLAAEDDENDQWYSEGSAVFYERLLPLRAGAISPDDFLRNLNSTAGRYYTDALNRTANDEISKRFWEDTRIRTLPYDRGSLYLAVVNAEVLKRSGGRRSLDDLIFKILDLHRHGDPVSRRTWTDLLEREAGPRATTEFRDMLAGAVVLPASDAFGPCFRRVTRPLRRYQLGFDPKVLIEPSRTVRGLVPSSAAQLAGLRDGDRILKPVPQDGIQGNQTERLTLLIGRADSTLEITYLPRGETVSAYQWQRVPGVADSACVMPFHKAPGLVP